VNCNGNSWSPPPVSCLKLNVDAHLSDDGRWALGWLMRKSDGSCAGAGTKVLKGLNDVAMAKSFRTSSSSELGRKSSAP
jgi:hypothetical protein